MEMDGWLPKGAIVQCEKGKRMKRQDRTGKLEALQCEKVKRMKGQDRTGNLEALQCEKGRG